VIPNITSAAAASNAKIRDVRVDEFGYCTRNFASAAVAARAQEPSMVG
jgi:hypothetical protein